MLADREIQNRLMPHNGPDYKADAAARRVEELDAVAGASYDVAVIGGGINGACLYHELCERGYRAIVLDKGDFASGTSQASAMWIWGGLRYLARAEFATVVRLCASRDLMVRTLAHAVVPQTFHLLPGPDRPGHAARALLLGLYLYWLLGAFRRRRPCRVRDFPERELLGGRGCGVAVSYEEAQVRPSDARFVLSWILPYRSIDSPALNYCALRGGGWDGTRRQWRLELMDHIAGRQIEARARCVVNAAGCWTDSINARFGRAAPWKHLFGKGVFIGVSRDPRHRSPLIMPTDKGGRMSLIPWGPVSLWGPADSLVNLPEEGFEPAPDDVARLFDQLNRHLARPLGAESLISVRCGVRPLAAARSRTAAASPIDHLSRRSAVYRDPELPWISVYGGKLTYCIALAGSVVACVREIVSPTLASNGRIPASPPAPEMEFFPGLRDAVPSARWCAKYELCWTLDDYLRRRTNIAQWIPHGGFGPAMRNRPWITQIAGAWNGLIGRDQQTMAATNAPTASV